MKHFLIFFLLAPFMTLRAEEEMAPEPPGKEDAVPDPLTLRALAGLEKRLGIKFDVPFPATFDVDAYQKLPIALIPINGSKVCATRPIVNPFDEPYQVEWMLGPGEVAEFGKDSLDCSFDLDDQGDFIRTNLIVEWATDGVGTHQLERTEGETSAAFFERALLTYRTRAKKAKDPAQAELYLAAFEKIASAIQTLRKEAVHSVPGTKPE